MRPYTEQRLLPFSDQQLFDLVADIQKYPEFLPWCLGARLETLDPQSLRAQLTVGYKIFKESYISRVMLEPYKRIVSIQEKGPFKYLETIWTFKALEVSKCQVDFYLSFEFQSSAFNFLMGQFFEQASHTMMQAFEKRAVKLYGAGNTSSDLRYL